MTRERALQIARQQASGMPPGVAITLSAWPVRRPAAPIPFLDVLPHASGSWVALCDPEPAARWGHDARYLLIDPDGAVRAFAAPFYPTQGTDPLHDEQEF